MSAAPLLRYDTGPTAADLRGLAALQKEHAPLFRDLELGMPQPGATERPAEYGLRILTQLQRHSDQWVRADLSMLPAGTLATIAPMIIADATAVAADVTTGSFRHRGEMREIRKPDEAGRETIEFRGDPNSWMKSFMTPVVACVTAFNDRRRR